MASSLEDSRLSVSQTKPIEYLQNNLSPGWLNLKGINMGTATGSFGDFKLLNTESLSSGNLVSMLKAVVVLAINLFLIVIQVVAGILKALLPFLK